MKVPAPENQDWSDWCALRRQNAKIALLGPVLLGSEHLLEILQYRLTAEIGLNSPRDHTTGPRHVRLERQISPRLRPRFAYL